MRRIQVVDSHTGGEPTRVVISGGPDLGHGDLTVRRDRFRDQYDDFRRAVVCEPRGSEVIVGALLCPPTDKECVAGVIFFNNVGYIGMCGHGTIGLAVTLGHMGRITAGRFFLETPVGKVAFEYDGRNSVSLDNVPSYRYRSKVPLLVEGIGEIHGDIAWGGNWFFLVDEPPLPLTRENTPQLTDLCWRVRRALERDGITGENGGVIDHIEWGGPPQVANNHGRNFVLCPGGAYDRSPCGTGTSAKLACLAADGKLGESQTWRQESILGSVFEGSYRRLGDKILPRITGQAHVTAEATLLIDDADPLGWGLSS